MDLSWLNIVLYVLFLVAAGYFIPLFRNRKLSRTFAWIIALATVIVSSQVTSGQSPLVRMLIIVFLQLLSMKVIVAAEVYADANRCKKFQWLAFSVGWFGMRPALFEKLPAPALPYIHLVNKGVTSIAGGFFLLYLSFLTERFTKPPAYFISSLLLLIGVSLILHFGVLNLAAALWRWMGVDVAELFRSPYRSRSLKEFWGKRWNIAFSEMTTLIAYRPLKGKVGKEKAMIASFLLSGLLHEIAISLPVRAGYGLPMLYFTIHAVAMYAEERSNIVQKIIAHRFLSRVWVMALLVLPLPLLFHQEFMVSVLVPLRNMLLMK